MVEITEILQLPLTIASLFANFIKVFPIWGQSLLVAGFFYFDSQFVLPVNDIPLLNIVLKSPIEQPFGNLVNTVTGLFGINLSSLDLSIMFFVSGVVLIILAAQRLGNNQ